MVVNFFLGEENISSFFGLISPTLCGCKCFGNSLNGFTICLSNKVNASVSFLETIGKKPFLKVIPLFITIEPDEVENAERLDFKSKLPKHLSSAKHASTNIK